MGYLVKTLEEFLKRKSYTLLEFQKKAIINTHSRKNFLIVSPTGTGKTFAAFFGILNELFDLKQRNALENKTYAIYISPLRALTYDIEKNLKEVIEFSESKQIRIGIWTSDIKSKQKLKQQKPHILLTTPESFAYILLSEHFNNFDWVIVDEIHALIDSKRGAYLDLLLKYAKLEHFFSITYLTATAYNNISEIIDVEEIINNSTYKKIKLHLINPIIPNEQNTIDNAIKQIVRIKETQKYRTIIIFTNTRPLAELVGVKLKQHFNVEVHHSSLSYPERRRIEHELKQGKLDFIISSTSLELGIDIGSIDATILFGSPKTITKALQRIGRSGHKLKSDSIGIFISLNIRDLFEIIGIINGIKNKIIERTYFVKHPYDVMCHFIAWIALINKNRLKQSKKPLTSFEVYQLIKSSKYYQGLKYEKYLNALKMYKEFKIIKMHNDSNKEYFILKKPSYFILPKLTPIPSQDIVKVKVKNRIIGYLDRDFVEYLIKEDSFSLGGKFYAIENFEKDTIKVKRASTGNISRWYSSYLPISIEVGRELRKFLKRSFDIFKEYKLDEIFFDKKKNEIIEKIKTIFNHSDEILYLYLKKIYLFFYPKLDFSNFLLESFKIDNKHYLVMHTFLGKRFNDALSRILALMIANKDVEIGIDDLSFYLVSEKLNIDRIKEIKKYDKEKIKTLLEQSIEKTISYRKRVKALAMKMLFVDQFFKSLQHDLIFEEAKREFLMDHFHFDELIKEIKEKEFIIVAKDVPSPLTQTLFENAYKDLLIHQSIPEFIQEMKQLIEIKINLKIGKILKKNKT